MSLSVWAGHGRYAPHPPCRISFDIPAQGRAQQQTSTADEHNSRMKVAAVELFHKCLTVHFLPSPPCASLLACLCCMQIYNTAKLTLVLVGPQVRSSGCQRHAVGTRIPYRE
jgi:hypothetical protein